MGFRFRKSFKIAPGVKLNLGKKSAGISVGGKGFRKSFSTSGRSTTSIGVPGTGLSYVSTSSGSSKSKKSSNKGSGSDMSSSKKSGCWIIAVPVLIILFILGGIKSCIDGDVDSSSLTTAATTFKSNIESIEFANNVPDNLVVGDSKSSYIKIEADDEFSEDDIVFVSSAPEIITVTLERKGYQLVYFDINAISAGTATIYAGTQDGLVISEEVVITVSNAETTAEEKTTVQETESTTAEKTTVTAETTTEKIVTTIKEKTTKNIETTKKVTTTKKESGGEKAPANNKEYVLNTNTKKIHYGSCSSVEDIKPENYSKTTDYDKAIAQGYVPCKRCNP